MTTVEAASLLLSLLAVAISVCAVYAVRNATAPRRGTDTLFHDEPKVTRIPEEDLPLEGAEGSLVAPGGWHVPADQVIPPVSEWPGYDEAAESPRLETVWVPSPLLTAHQRTEVLRIFREESTMAAMSREAEILAKRGRRAKA